ncbi:hypothetical protein ACJOYG_14015 [Acinetobacter baumannii]
MDNYKIKVKDEAESKEAQELLKQLGFQEEGFTGIGLPCYLATWDGGYADYYFGSLSEGRKREELTLPQLRDLVVLKRNDVKDSNRQAERGGEYFITSDGDIYFWMGKWVPSTLGSTESLMAIETNPPQDPALISGADVPRLIKEGNQIQLRAAIGFKLGEWKDLDLEQDEEEFTLGDLINSRFEWRLKPQTIKVELELPKPFEPKDGERYFYLNPHADAGYGENTTTKWNKYLQFGAWSTEEEIKQVVEQLRKIRGTNS